MKKEMVGDYINANMALMAMQTCQMLFALQGYSCTASIYLAHERCELTVHFDGYPMPQLPHGYTCSSYDIESHNYWSETLQRTLRVRTKTFYFTWPTGA